MTNTAAAIMIRHLLDNAPFHVRAAIAPIWHNFVGGTDLDVLRSMRNVIGPRDEAHVYAAAQHAHEVLAAA